MSYQIIKAPLNSNYIKDIPEYNLDLPDNCYLDKTIVGSGGTTHALTNEIPYVIAVPFISLAENKRIQIKGVRDIHSGISDELIKRYISKGGKKFIVTYDSLPRLEKFINIKDYKLLVDEAHKLVEYGADFKPKVIHHILTNYMNYKSYCFMTATPTREEFLPDELANINKIKIIWDNSSPVNIVHQRCNLQLDNIVSNICLDHLRGNREGNAYLFYNSIKAIAKTIKTLKKLHLGLSSDDVKIICANNEQNQELVRRFIGASWSISKPIDKDDDGDLIIDNKKITFVTATAFEGSDFLDEDGVTYIISDGRKVHTKLDITTQVSQIVGRIRNSKYNNSVNMLWTHSPIENCITEEEYSSYLDKEETEARIVIEDFTNSKATTTKKALINYTITNPFFIDNTEESPDLLFNTVARKALMNTYVGMELTYNVINNNKGTEEDLVPASLKDIFTTLESENIFEPLSGADKLKLGKTPNFKKVCKDYEEALLNKNQETIDIIETDIDYKDLTDFVEKLGLDKLSSTDYRLKNIQAELSKHRLYNESPDTLRSYLRLQNNVFYPLSTIKERLTLAYEALGIDKKAKATDIQNLYQVKSTIRNGNKGFCIIKKL